MATPPSFARRFALGQRRDDARKAQRKRLKESLYDTALDPSAKPQNAFLLLLSFCNARVLVMYIVLSANVGPSVPSPTRSA